MKFLAQFLTFSLVAILKISAALKADDCEVCIATINKFVDTLDDSQKKDPKAIEESFKKYCKNSKGKENRFVSKRKQKMTCSRTLLFL